MVGFVGTQARKRKRNRFLIIFLIIFVTTIFFYLPSINFSNNDQNLPDEILPNNILDEKSFASEIEELKLEVFQKDQRIKFRDSEIKNLRDEIKNLNQSLNILKTDYESAISDVNKLENNSSLDTSQNNQEIKKLKKEVNKLNFIISDYDEKILQLENEIDNSTSSSDFQKINIENSILKTEIKQMKEKNIESQEILNRLKLLIEEKDNLIRDFRYLKDLQHHG